MTEDIKDKFKSQIRSSYQDIAKSTELMTKLVKNISVENINNGVINIFDKNQLSSKIFNYPIEWSHAPSMSKKDVKEWNKQDRHLQMGGLYEDNRDYFKSIKNLYEEHKYSKIDKISCYVNKDTNESQITIYFENHNKPDKVFKNGYYTFKIPYDVFLL